MVAVNSTVAPSVYCFPQGGILPFPQKVFGWYLVEESREVAKELYS